MKKIFYSFTAGLAITGLALIGLFGSGCTKVNDTFDQDVYDSLTRISNNITYNYTMLTADYKTIGTAVQKPIQDQINAKIAAAKLANHTDSLALIAESNALKLDPTYIMGGNVTSFTYLPKAVINGSWVPTWLNTKYMYADVDSKVLLTYNAEFDTTTITNKATLTTANYDAMGTATGQPGKNDYFSSSISPTYYIPIFLKQSFPYAKPGDTWLIRYRYYVSSTSTVNRWLVSVYDGTNWSNTGFVTPKVLQYTFRPEGWVMDPTITIPLVKGNPNNTYVMNFINYLIAHKADAVNPTPWYPKLSYVNEEHYYGFSAYYPEIICTSDRTIYGDAAIKALTTDEARYALYRQRVALAMPLFTQVNFPLLQTQVSGIQQYVIFTIPSYYSSSKSGMYTIKMKCIVSGTESAPAQYEVVSCVEVLN